MAVTFTIDEASHLTVFTVTGRTGLEDLQAGMKAAWPAGPTRLSLWDFRGAFPGEPTGYNAAGALLAFRAGLGGHEGSKTAVVSPAGSPAFAYVRQYEIMAEAAPRWRVRSFDDIETALQWLSEQP